MKSTNFNKELRSKSLAELTELETSAERALWKTKFSNHSNTLDDTAKVRRERRDVARIKTALTAASAPTAVTARAAK